MLQVLLLRVHLDIKQNSGAINQVDLQAVLYDKNNYTSFEGNVTLPAGVYTLPSVAIIGQVGNLVVSQNDYSVGSLAKSRLIITWTKPEVGFADSYTLKYRIGDNNFKTINHLQFADYEIDNIEDGIYEIIVFAITAAKVNGPPT